MPCSREQDCTVLVALMQLWVVMAESFTVSVPVAPLVARLGDDLTVPCHISPEDSAVAMEVRWSREGHTHPVLLYRHQQETQGQDFVGRLALSRAGLEKGNVSLVIREFRLRDEGRYICFVDSGLQYHRAAVEVKVSMTGSAPLVSLDGHQSGGIALSCDSQGWYPKPEVQWIDQAGSPFTVSSRSQFTQTPNGLYSVRSQILLSGQEQGAVSCVVRHGRDGTQVQSRVYISEGFFKPAQPWIISTVCFVLFSVVCLIFIIYVFKMREGRRKLHQLYYTDKSDIYKANITMDPETSHSKLKVSEDGKCVQFNKDQKGVPDNPKRYKYWPGVLGCEAFSSGKHYWEVKVDGLDHWDLGVAKESVSREQFGDIQPSDGYWSIWFVYNEYRALDKKRTIIKPKQTVQTVGIYLDYDRGRLSFYDVEEQLHLYTFHNKFTEKLYPVFNPWESTNPLVLI
ncbi:butyrophilin subfamily 1 member A1 isoform X1 [Amia ocellicauda]|uniref:butyrophilin subfamily 1 member A1 isoform X1 n=2 Tax=Amia ocellicauda TaxID=2972642 RepID=UPI00346389A4